MGDSFPVLDKPIIPRWLRLRDAAPYSALSPRRLIELARTGEVVGFLDDSNRRGKSQGEWIFDRESLDNYRQAQAGGLAAVQGALDAMRRLGL